MPFIETSARKCSNVEEAFNIITRGVIKELKKQNNLEKQTSKSLNLSEVKPIGNYKSRCCYYY